MLYILYRKLSDYGHDDIILGVFDNKNKAFSAKKKYLFYTKSKDPYHCQPYFQVDLDNDVTIVEKYFIPQKIDNNYKKIYIILYVVNGKDQTYRNIVNIYDNKKEFDKEIRNVHQKYNKLQIWKTLFSKTFDLSKKKFSPIEIEIVDLNALRFHNKTKYLYHFF